MVLVNGKEATEVRIPSGDTRVEVLVTAKEDEAVEDSDVVVVVEETAVDGVDVDVEASTREVHHRQSPLHRHRRHPATKVTREDAISDEFHLSSCVIFTPFSFFVFTLTCIEIPLGYLLCLISRFLLMSLTHESFDDRYSNILVICFQKPMLLC